MLTRGTKAIGQKPAEDWRLEEDFEGLDGFSPEGLYFDTPALAAGTPNPAALNRFNAKSGSASTGEARLPFDCQVFC